MGVKKDLEIEGVENECEDKEVEAEHNLSSWQ